MPDTRIIKRYANRKLYDTEHSRYVTLDQISEMIRNGDDVKIVDNKTKEDLTTVTLAQIIFEEEKKQRSFLPLGAMRNIIQSGGEWFAEAQRRVQSILPGKRGKREGRRDRRAGRSTSRGDGRADEAAGQEAQPRVAARVGRSLEAAGSTSGRSRSTARSATRSRASRRRSRRGRASTRTSARSPIGSPSSRPSYASSSTHETTKRSCATAGPCRSRLGLAGLDRDRERVAGRRR